MRPGLFVPIKWRLPECPRLILPLAVNLKRFLAPRWVFNFNFGFDAFLGIAVNPLDKFLCRWLRRAGAAPPPQKYNVSEKGGLEAAPTYTPPNPCQKILFRFSAPITATAGRWTTAVPRVWRRSRLFSAPATPPGRCLPCAAWFRSGPGRQSPQASGSSWRARLPGAPFRVRDEKSWRALCGLRRGSG